MKFRCQHCDKVFNTGGDAAKHEREVLIASIVDGLDQISTAQRVEILNRYCRGCGYNDGRHTRECSQSGVNEISKMNYVNIDDVVVIQYGVRAVFVGDHRSRDCQPFVGGARAQVVACGSCVMDLKLLDAVDSIAAGTLIGIDSHGRTGAAYVTKIEAPKENRDG